MIRVVVQDDKGNEVGQAVDVPTAAIARPGDARFACLRFVDPYGDTVFNALQLVTLLEDIRLLRRLSSGDQHEPVFRRIETLIAHCQAEPHLYLKLVGD